MLTGNKITLRGPRVEDGDILYELSADLDSWEQRRADPPRPLSRVEFDAKLAADQSSPDGVLFVIEAGGAVVGRCAAFHIDRYARTAELGIALLAAERGKGYGTDALRVLVAFLFERWNLRRVHLMTLASNLAGQACYRKIGFVEEGRQREHAFVSGHYEDMILYGLLRSEWSAAPPG